VAVTTCHTPRCTGIPDLWLLSDARNDAVLDHALCALPNGSGFVFRHYHLAPAARRARFDTLAATARHSGHLVIMADDGQLAEIWGADGIYGPAQRLPAAARLMRLAAVHDEDEIRSANAMHADAVFLSPVFPTRSHPEASGLGPERFRQLASLAQMPVIALGGMTHGRARSLGWPRWAAIDGLVAELDS